ncbi:MAG: HK97 gp10 family phage protein [Ruminococcus sp.]|nr:HK97 gp10 family phage protein [Ruminococcus sp.]
MAKAEIVWDDEFFEKLESLGKNTDKIIEKTLEAGAKAALPYFQAYLSESVGNSEVLERESRSTGELVRSVGISGVRIDSKGVHNIKIGFHEPRRDGTPNAKIANIIEYGKKSANQPPRPFLSKTKRKSKPAVEAAMKKAFDEEVNKL